MTNTLVRPPEEPRKVYTFQVSGELRITLQVKGSPPLRHMGGTTLWKLAGTPKEAEDITSFLQAQGGLTVQVFCEEQTAEQTLFRVGTTGNPGFR